MNLLEDLETNFTNTEPFADPMPPRTPFFLGACLCAPVLCSGQFSGPRPVTTEFVLDAGVMAVGDTDNDGDLEVVVGGWAGLALFENMDGQGAFQPVVVLDRSVYIWCEALHVVDVDDDGLADIVIEHEDIAWCRNLGGNGFSPPEPFPGTGPNHHMIAFDDYDGDGDQDAIMIMPPGNLVRMENLGAGQFGMAAALGTVQYDSDLTLFDLDGDGDQDITATEYTGIEARVFRNNGNGTFSLTSTLPLIGCGAVGGNHVVAADVDDDGNEDLVLRQLCNGQIEWRRSLGDGTFQPPVLVAAFSDMTIDILFLDLNDDGLRDLVALTHEDIQASLNQGAGAFSPAQPLTRSILNTYHGALCAADINADGLPELFAADIGYSRVRQFHLPGDGSLAFHQFLGDYTPRPFEFVRIADLNGDAYPDVVRTYDYEGMVVAYASDQAGQFILPHILARTDTTLQADIDLIDMDEDGDLDLIVLADSLHLYTNQGGFQFVKTYSYFSPQFDYNSRLKCNDLDGDGDVDILYTSLGAIRRLRNNGDNTFTQLPNISPLQFGARFGPLMDVDGDGDQDVLADDDGDLVWIRNDGSLNFAPRVTIGFFYDHVDTADIDMDGDLDIFCSGLGPDAYWWERTGPATFAAAQQIGLSGLLAGWPRIADVDSDGDPDVVVLDWNGGGSVALNDGSGNFGAPQFLISMEGIIDYAEEACFADMDLDGDIDIVHCWEDAQGNPLMLAWRENLGITTGLEEVARTSMSLAPNPFLDHAQLVLSAPLTAAQRLEIVDVHGRILRSMPGGGDGTMTVDRAGLSSGVYLLDIREAGRSLGSIRMVIH